MAGPSGGTSAPSGVRSARREALAAIDRRYLVLSGVLVVGLTIQTLNQQWSSDMWQHVAVVRELKTHLSDPNHPLMLGTEPHPFYSPYTVAVGALARIGGLSAVTALSIAAVANLLLFLTALYLAVSALTDRPRAAFWALLFTLVLWGIIPWRWSGYMNANSIGFGLPYPSMFAAGVTLLGFATMVRLCRRPDLRLALGLAACVVVVALTHPLTSGALVLGLLAIALSSRGVRSKQTILLLAGAGLLALVLVLLWPYYSWFQLLQKSDLYDNHAMYVSVPQRGFIGLASLLFLWPAWRRDHRDPLVLMAVGAAGAYVLGFLSDTESLGRMFPLLMLSGHVAAARWVTDAVDGRDVRSFRPRWVQIALGGAVVVGAIGVSPVMARVVPRGVLPSSLRDDPELASVPHRFRFLAPVAQYDVVLTDDALGAMVVPAFSGKVVRPGYPVPFVDDIDRRSRDVQTMLADKDPAVTRRLLARYSVDFILLKAGDVRERRLARYGEVVHQGSGYVLIRLPVA